MFKIGQTVICVDHTHNPFLKGMQGELLHLAQYVVEDYREQFVKLEGVKGEWPETRFILVEEVAQ